MLALFLIAVTLDRVSPQAILLRQKGVAAAAGDARKPDKAILDRLEAELQNNRCVGSINALVRRYAYALDGSYRLSVDQISFSLKKVAGTRGRREVTLFIEFPEVDDRQFHAVTGYYSVSRNRVTVTFCGLNRPTG